MSADERSHELLPWFMTGKLDQEESERFARHLEDCEHCRNEKEFLEKAQAQLDRHGAAFLEDHPASGALVAYARGELAGEAAASVRQHIEICRTCTIEVGWITGGTADRIATREVPPPPTANPWKWVAAVAALLAIAAFLWPRGTPDAIGGFGSSQFVEPVQRFDGERNVVGLEPGSDLWMIHFQVDLAVDEFPCDLTLLDAEGTALLARRGVLRQALVNDLYGQLHCSRTSCPPGEYRIRIDAADGTTVETLAFRVVARP